VKRRHVPARKWKNMNMDKPVKHRKVTVMDSLFHLLLLGFKEMFPFLFMKESTWPRHGEGGGTNGAELTYGQHQTNDWAW